MDFCLLCYTFSVSSSWLDVLADQWSQKYKSSARSICFLIFQTSLVFFQKYIYIWWFQKLKFTKGQFKIYKWCIKVWAKFGWDSDFVFHFSFFSMWTSFNYHLKYPKLNVLFLPKLWISFNINWSKVWLRICLYYSACYTRVVILLLSVWLHCFNLVWKIDVSRSYFWWFTILALELRSIGIKKSNQENIKKHQTHQQELLKIIIKEICFLSVKQHKRGFNFSLPKL